MFIHLSKDMAWGGLFMRMLVKNQIQRLWQRKKNVILYLVLTAGSIIVAVIMSSQSFQFAHIAVVDNGQLLPLYNESIDIDYVRQVPLLTDLITQKYDAIVEVQDQQLLVHTYKNKDFEKQLIDLLTNEHEPIQQVQHRGEMIYGYMIMFIMMAALFYTTLYGEDKENHMLQRIRISGCSLFQYLLSQSFVTLILSWGFPFIILVIIRLFGFDIGFSLLEYAFLLFVLTLFSTAFSIFMNSIFDKETTSLSASALIVLTSLLSGTFYSFINDDGIIGICIQFLPQKVLMGLSENITHFKQEQWIGLIYLLGCIIIFYLISKFVGEKSLAHH